MSIISKLRKAAHIVRDDGPAALGKALVERYAGGSPREVRPNEVAMAYQVLTALGYKGVMIDVGAHFGESLESFARAGWRVFAFEPDSLNRERLTATFGGHPNVRIDGRAVSDLPGTSVTLYRSEDSTGVSGLSAFHPSHFGAETVDVTTLRSVLEEFGEDVESIEFLKVDTEGFDLPVLKGFPWERFEPRLILCEFEDAKTVPLGYSFHDLARFLQEKQYQLIVSEWYPITKYGGPHDWRRFATYPCELGDARAWGNIFAARERGLHEAVLRTCGRWAKAHSAGD